MITKRSLADGRRGFHSWRLVALTLLLAVVSILVSSVRLSAVRAATIQVAAGGDFQAALNAAQPGDTIVLAAGATFVGPFTLPYKVGSGTDADWITIRTSAPDSALPPAGQRITPDYSPVLPKLVSPGANQSALYTQPRAHHYRFVGVEFSPINSSAVVDTLVNLGNEGTEQDTLDEVPHHLVLDRCYVYAFPSQSLKRGVRLNSAHTDILNSYIAGFKLVGQDSQAVMGSNGPGPFRVINNYLEGAGENLMFGGADPTIPNLVPSDIQIRRNYFSKPLSWRVGDPSYAGTHWTVKNLLELKNAQRVSISGNLFEHNWLDATGAYNIGWAARGEWLEYTVNVASTGTYTVEARVASQVNGGTFHIEFDGLDKTGAMTVPNTGGWQTYQTVTKTGVSLAAGQHVMRLALDTEGASLPDGMAFVGNFNYLKFTADAAPPSNPPYALRLNAGAAQYVGEGCQTWQADNYYQNGSTYYASNLSTADILNTFDDELYRGERYGGAPGTAPLAYAIPLPNDTYRVRLHFAEVWHGVSNTNGAGARVFDVSVENQLVLDNFDIYAAAGGAQRAVVREVQTAVTDGVLNISLAASADNAKISAIEVFNGPVPAANAPFREQGGQVVVEAENSHASITRGGKQWAIYRNASRPAGSVCGGAMVSEPDSGVQIDAGYATTAPERQYQIQFTTPGTYYVWLRAWAANTNNNSVNVGLDGQPTTTADRVSIGTFNAWTWVRSTMDGPVATLVVPTAGQHTVNVWMREDGMWIDRILLTTISTFVPNGQEPPESPR